MQKTLKLGLLTISDRVVQGIYKDLSGPAMKNWIQKAIVSPLQILQAVVADEKTKISQKLQSWVDNENCHLIFTSGGTGPASKDVTPEATLAIADKIMDGFGERMRCISLKYVPTAILSRQVAVIRGCCLIVNLPGNPRSIKETLDELFEAIPYCIELLEGPIIKTSEFYTAFFPKK